MYNIMSELEKIRIAWGMTRNAFAKELGISQPTYYRLVMGQADIENLTLKTFVLLTTFLSRQQVNDCMDDIKNKAMIELGRDPF